MLIDFLPKPPHWTLNWTGILAAYPCLHKLADCIQDPIYHGEGDVLTHTHMVLTELVAEPRWRELSEQDRFIVFLAALFHDISKPETRDVEDGKVTHKNHSPIGAKVTRVLLWREGISFYIREMVCQLIKVHQLPFYLITKEPLELRKRLIEVSTVANNRLLFLLTLADAKGRICPDQQKIVDNVELFLVAAEEEGIANRPFGFTNDHSRVLYFNAPDTRDPYYDAYDDTTGEIILMSGLPGSGKSTYINKHYPETPIVSLDAIRNELKIKQNSDEMGFVVQTAKEKAKEYLRKKQTFIWDATALSRKFRAPILGLALDYNAWTKVVYLEKPESVLLGNNKSRKENEIVPESAIYKMLNHLEPPTLLECHSLSLITD